MQIRHKNLPVEVCVPPEPLKSAEFKASYSLGMIPVLDLLDGNTIGESTAIMNYLENIFPETPMRPVEPLAQAQNEMLIRYVDNHLYVGLSPMFKEYFYLVRDGCSTAEPDDSRFDLLIPELQKLEHLLTELPKFRERSLQTGDVCMICHLYFVKKIASYFGDPDIFADYAVIKDWLNWVDGFPAVEQSRIGGSA